MGVNHASPPRAQRRRRTLRWVVAVVLVGCVAGGTALAVATRVQDNGVDTAATGPVGPEGVPLEVGRPLAPEDTAATWQTVDGIRCDASEHVAYHIHAHLAVYVNGSLRPVPAGIGLVSPVAQKTAHGRFYSATSCYYWLHVHAQDGIIHVESPTERTYTLGQFFALWRRPLTARQVGPVRGPLTVFVNGRRYAGDPADITLRSREDIQIDVGTPVVAPARVDWDSSSL
jgi:hypothetical protein